MNADPAVPGLRRERYYTCGKRRCKEICCGFSGGAVRCGRLKICCRSDPQPADRLRRKTGVLCCAGRALLLSRKSGADALRARMQSSSRQVSFSKRRLLLDWKQFLLGGKRFLLGDSSRLFGSKKLLLGCSRLLPGSNGLLFDKKELRPARSLSVLRIKRLLAGKRCCAS
jgi:hypothetical protein